MESPTSRKVREKWGTLIIFYKLRYSLAPRRGGPSPSVLSGLTALYDIYGASKIFQRSMGMDTDRSASEHV
jgi:hypothetical protein